MRKLLGLSIENDEVRACFGSAIASLTRDEYYGAVEFKNEGVEVVLKEAPWVLSPKEVINAEILHVAAFLLHGESHEGYHAFKGELPLAVAFGDTLEYIERTLGVPEKAGGGEFSKLFRSDVPQWIRYWQADHFIRFQFSSAHRLEMVSIFIEAPQ